MAERRVQRRRRLLQVRDDVLLFLARQPALGAGEVRGKRGEHRQLAGEGLGRGDADLRAGVGREQQVRLARHGAGRHVDDHRDALLLAARVAERRKRVRRLARLTDEERQAARLEHRLAVAELAGDIDVDRHSRELLDPIFGDHAGVEAGAAGDDRDPADRG